MVIRQSTRKSLMPSTNYSLPTATTSSLGGVKVGTRLSITDGILSADAQTAAATLRSPHVATVYVAENWSIVAIGPTGNVISQGSDASTVITAALATIDPNGWGMGGEIRIRAGVYTLTSTIYVTPNTTINCEKYTYLKIQTNIDGFWLTKGSCIHGAVFDLYNVPAPGYQNAVITFNGNDQLGFENVTGLRDVEIFSDTFTGTAILLRAESETVMGICCGIMIDGVRIFGFYYGLRLYRSGAALANWINANKFCDMAFYETRRAVYMDSSLTTGEDLYGNVFENISVQGGGTPSEPTIHIHGTCNAFRNICVYDWLEAWGPAIAFTAGTMHNLFEFLDWENAAWYISNLGTGNRITTQWGTVDVPLTYLDTDVTLAANSDSKIATQKAVKTSVDAVAPKWGQLYHFNKQTDSSGTVKVIQPAAYGDQGTSSAIGDIWYMYVYKTGSETILDLHVYKSDARGTFSIYVNGVLDSTENDYYVASAAHAYVAITFSNALVAGWNEIKWVCTGKNASSTGYQMQSFGGRLR